METIKVSSGAFESGEQIPGEYTCSGKNISPPLSWSDVPPGTKSIVIILEDPDSSGGIFSHWILYNIPPDHRDLMPGVERKPVLMDGSRHGLNNYGKMEYGGPCPPPGNPHRYFFRIFALDTVLALRAPVTRKVIEDAMAGHVLAKGELMGKFRR
ncbi:Raf kinase inhibitor-like YbhB/YbcL family protein [Methanolinea mesophila]|uniref:YbhB/YbcL family Raf kinase inhibitor-like protein n=1 Tax=Methanolinea mesophila TaxID=547055 RepID=UPI001AEA41F3|nr:YbhB/YbcL family Raf kinase inhibitor-like protein [Methanolinea mesophila]MBP1929835.1 Raf kinase inhibitor-like YbhB/YbcL family protein [Methanolinea mesophila]